MPRSVAPTVRRRLHRRVLDWYRTEGRPLAFRSTSDPWAILVSEVMAQQTQAARAAEAWEGFVERYPTAAAFAAVSPATAVREWQGLGYNRRAIALHQAARLIVERHGGSVPDDIEALLALPGIGPYTARAVSALAFGRRVGAVDTNVRRVLGRAFSVVDAATLQVVADEIVPANAPGTWTHALMDIGARLCKPRRPTCGSCPLRSDCAFARDATEDAPLATATPATVAHAAPAAPAAPARAKRPPAQPFESTSRWLRGRVLDRLRSAPDGEWLRIVAPIGGHETLAVEQALSELARDGLLERGAHAMDARLPTG